MSDDRSPVDGTTGEESGTADKTAADGPRAEGPGVADRPGESFQRATRYERQSLRGWRLDWERQPSDHKEYPADGRVPLPEPLRDDGPGLWSLLQRRRSERRYAQEGLTLAELGQVLWAGDGMTLVGADMAFRSAPSAGALYPIETYVAVHRVADLAAGVWHYDVRRHALDPVRTGDVRVETARAALDQQIALTADAVLLWTAVFARTTWKYPQRGYRYMYMEAGHIAQNTALAALGLGLATCQIAALYDDEANALVGADGGRESVLYMSTLARRRETTREPRS
ncbi:MAG: SagB/ThcOx family dehydrogenase [Actinobacteria bacterium]|nr:SagB/ThcOx family dehydrogenase [Actinomycetota bacterium]